MDLGILNENSDECNVIDSYSTHQMDNSTINLFTLTMGGELHRSNIDFNIKGSGCSNKIGMLMLGKAKDHIDCHFDINHHKNIIDKINDMISRFPEFVKAHRQFNCSINGAEQAADLIEQEIR